MNCFMGYNPLVTKQVKVTVWVCEQDGATPVAPSNPSEGDCFIVYATDEAMLSNDPTSKKTYTNGDWADAEGGGGGIGTIVTITLTTTEAFFNGHPEGSGTGVDALLYKEGVGWLPDESLSESDTSLTVALIEESAYCLTVYSEPTVTGDATVKKSAQYDEWEITVSGDCTITT